ncbi:MAG TPA: hypothetical protein DIW21_04930 [Enterococcus sp.]|nr:hypothetical protein [Enterococcus sp.]
MQSTVGGDGLIDISFNDYNLSDLLTVTKGFTALNGADYEPIVKEKSGASTGSNFVYTSKKIKQIKIPFFMNDDTTSSYDLLQKILNVQEPKKLVIGYFPNRYFLAVPNGSLDFEEIKVKGTGTLTFLVPDGLAHGTVLTPFTFINTNNGYLETTLVNNGTADVSVNYDIDFHDDCGYVGIVSEYGVIQVGSENESDYSTKKAQYVIADDAKTGTLLDNWTHGTGYLTEPFPTSGNFSIEKWGNRYWLYPSNFANPGKYTWGGVGQSRSFSADSYGSVAQKHFELETRAAFVNGAPNQKGLMEITLADESGKNLIGVVLDKGLNGNRAKIRLYLAVNNQHIDIDTGKNEYVSLDTGVIRITKKGSSLQFGFAKRTVSYVVSQIKDVKYKTVTLFSGKQQGYPAMTLQRFEYLKVRALFVDETYDSPNTFMNGDNLYLDGERTIPYRNTVAMADMPGSKWFKVPPGETTIKLYYSSFSAVPPTATAYLREAYL